MSDKLLKFMQLTKVDAGKNHIHGVFTAEQVDASGEIADYDTTKSAMEKWSGEMLKVSDGKSKGNVRLMHGQTVAGKVVEIVYDDVKKIISGIVEVTAEIRDQALKGLLNGFSIGGGYAKKWPDPVHKGAKRFTPVIAEISIVDNPCLPVAIFNAVKDASFAIMQGDGTEVMCKFAAKEVEKEPDIKTVYKAKDGSLHDTEDLAKAKNTELAKAADPVEDALKKLEKAADPEEKKEEDGDKDADKLSCADLEKALTGDLSEDQVAGMRKLLKNDALFKDWKKPEVKPDLTDALTKMTAERDALQKRLDEVPARIEAALEKVNKRLKTIEEQPAAGGQLFLVDKDKSDVTPVVARGLSPAQIANKI